MAEFTLPLLTQDDFSSYYGKQVPRIDGIVETIVYPGQRLSCSSRSRNIKNYVQPHNVFITKIEKDGTFQHRLCGNDNVWSILPKRLHTACFPKIHIGSIPTDNRVRLQLTDTIFEVLPYIPDDFYKVKQIKAERPRKPVTRRVKRQRLNENQSKEHLKYIGWFVSGIEEQREELGIPKEKMMSHLKHIMDQISASDTIVDNPFDRVKSPIDLSEQFKTIIQFVHYYCREELGMQSHESILPEEDVWDDVKSLL